jgi:flagellar motility protein MotE (MotC chaperone)
MRVLRRIGRARGFGISVTGFLVCLFVASALVRLAGGTAQAIAKEVGGIPQLDAASLASDASSRAGDDRKAQSERIDRIFEELERREKQLDEREKALDLRSKDLEAVSMAVDQKLAELSETETRLRSVLDLASTAAESDVAQLTSMYENMKPKEAAPLFDEMAPKFAAGFLRRMRPEVAAEIISGLEPQKAYAISVILAGRNMDVPTE